MAIRWPPPREGPRAAKAQAVKQLEVGKVGDHPREVGTASVRRRDHRGVGVDTDDDSATNDVEN